MFKLTNLSFFTNGHVHFDYRLKIWMTHVFFDYMDLFDTYNQVVQP